MNWISATLKSKPRIGADSALSARSVIRPTQQGHGVLMLALIGGFAIAATQCAFAGIVPKSGNASWYGEDHRGRLMANGRKFDPDKLTAASWFYPLGSKVRVTLNTPNRAPRQVLVTITDRGPALDLVRDGRIIDLTYAAFRRLAHPDRGLVQVKVQALR